jgi:DNA mismatch endonuclease, patch repair protein
MADKFSEDTRSKIMAKIRSKWTKPEKKLHGILKGNKVRHFMHPNLPGNPDAFLKDFNVILFVDGCFWHNCPIHGHIPEGNRIYWEPKILRNVARDKKNTSTLKKNGYIVIRLWECDVMKKDFKWAQIANKIKPMKHKEGT